MTLYNDPNVFSGLTGQTQEDVPGNLPGTGNLAVKPVSRVRSVFSGISSGLEGYRASEQPATLPFKPNFAYNAGAFIQGLAEGMGRTSANKGKTQREKLAIQMEQDRLELARKADVRAEEAQTFQHSAYDKAQKIQKGERANKILSDVGKLKGMSAEAQTRAARTLTALSEGDMEPAEAAAVFAKDAELRLGQKYADAPETSKALYNALLAEYPDDPSKAYMEADKLIAKAEKDKYGMLDMHMKIADLNLKTALRNWEHVDEQEARDMIGNLQSRYNGLVNEISGIVYAAGRQVPGMQDKMMAAFQNPEGGLDASAMTGLNMMANSNSDEAKEAARRLPDLYHKLALMGGQLDDLYTRGGYPKAKFPDSPTQDPIQGPPVDDRPRLNPQAEERESEKVYGNQNAFSRLGNYGMAAAQLISPTGTKGSKELSGFISSLNSVAHESARLMNGTDAPGILKDLTTDFIKGFAEKDAKSIQRMAENIDIPLQGDIPEGQEVKYKEAQIQLLMETYKDQPEQLWIYFSRMKLGDARFKSLDETAKRLKYKRGLLTFYDKSLGNTP